MKALPIEGLRRDYIFPIFFFLRFYKHTFSSPPLNFPNYFKDYKLIIYNSEYDREDGIRSKSYIHVHLYVFLNIPFINQSWKKYLYLWIFISVISKSQYCRFIFQIYNNRDRLKMICCNRFFLNSDVQSLKWIHRNQFY